MVIDCWMQNHVGVFGRHTITLSAIELSEQLHSRQITAVELLTKTLDRIEDVNPTINAIVSLKGMCVVQQVSLFRTTKLPSHIYLYIMRDIYY